MSDEGQTATDATFASVVTAARGYAEGRFGKENVSLGKTGGRTTLTVPGGVTVTLVAVNGLVGKGPEPGGFIGAELRSSLGNTIPLQPDGVLGDKPVLVTRGRVFQCPVTMRDSVIPQMFGVTA